MGFPFGRFCVIIVTIVVQRGLFISLGSVDKKRWKMEGVRDHERTSSAKGSSGETAMFIRGFR